MTTGCNCSAGNAGGRCGDCGEHGGCSGAGHCGELDGGGRGIAQLVVICEGQGLNGVGNKRSATPCVRRIDARHTSSMVVVVGMHALLVIAERKLSSSASRGAPASFASSYT